MFFSPLMAEYQYFKQHWRPGVEEAEATERPSVSLWADGLHDELHVNDTLFLMARDPLSYLLA